MNIYKQKMIIFAVGIVVVIGLFVWGDAGHKNIDSLPSLEQIAQMERGGVEPLYYPFYKARIKGSMG